MSKPDGAPNEVWKLFCAASDGDEATVSVLIRDTPELMHYQIWYEFPIHFAVRSGHAGVVQTLLNAGQNPAWSNFTYSSWQKLLPMAIERERAEVHRILVAEMKRRFNYDPSYKQLWPAIFEGDVVAVKKAIGDDASLVHVGDEHGNRAIHWAVLSRRIPIIDLLLEAGADIQAERADLLTPLQLSVDGDYWFHKMGLNNPETSQAEVTAHLLDSGAEYEFTVAVFLGDVDTVKDRLRVEPEIARRLNPSRRSPLYFAVSSKNIEIVRMLLELGADPNQPEHCADRGMALFEASSRCKLEMMTLLLEHGADADADVDSCGNCLSIAENGSEHQAEAIALLRAHGAHDGEWVATTPEKIAERLADESFQPGVDMWSGIVNSVLQCDDIQLLAKFVERFGVQQIRELNPTNGWRIPRSEAMLIELVRYGMSINARDWYGQTFLHHVVGDDSTDRACWLIAAGIDLNAIDHLSGTTALGNAASKGNVPMVELLLKHGADASLPKDERWARPVNLAAKSGHHDIVERLSIM
jgi:ankyrin repeat protein